MKPKATDLLFTDVQRLQVITDMFSCQWFLRQAEEASALGIEASADFYREQARRLGAPPCPRASGCSRSFA